MKLENFDCRYYVEGNANEFYPRNFAPAIMGVEGKKLEKFATAVVSLPLADLELIYRMQEPGSSNWTNWFGQGNFVGIQGHSIGKVEFALSGSKSSQYDVVGSIFTVGGTLLPFEAHTQCGKQGDPIAIIAIVVASKAERNTFPGFPADVQVGLIANELDDKAKKTQQRNKIEAEFTLAGIAIGAFYGGPAGATAGGILGKILGAQVAGMAVGATIPSLKSIYNASSVPNIKANIESLVVDTKTVIKNGAAVASPLFNNLDATHPGNGMTNTPFDTRTWDPGKW